MERHDIVSLDQFNSDAIVMQRLSTKRRHVQYSHDWPSEIIEGPGFAGKGMNFSCFGEGQVRICNWHNRQVIMTIAHHVCAHAVFHLATFSARVLPAHCKVLVPECLRLYTFSYCTVVTEVH